MSAAKKEPLVVRQTDLIAILKSSQLTGRTQEQCQEMVFLIGFSFLGRMVSQIVRKLRYCGNVQTRNSGLNIWWIPFALGPMVKN